MIPGSDALLKEALAKHRAGQLQEALALYRQVLGRDAGNYAAMGLMAALMVQLGEAHIAEKLFQATLVLRPDDGDAHFNYANLLTSQGRLPQAIGHYEQARAVNPHHGEVLQNLGSAYFLNQQMQQAADTWAHALEIKPDYLHARCGQGMALQSLGRLTQARALFEQVLQQDAGYVKAHYHLALIKKYSEVDEQFRQMLALADTVLDDESRSMLFFALAKACDDMKQHARAFEFYVSANEAEKKRLPPYSGEIGRSKIAQTRDAFEAAETLLQLKVSDDATPVFIVGLPRCGSTLVEQILASHPSVAGIGETALLTQALEIASLSSGAPYPGFVPMLDAPTLKAMAEYYLTRLRAQADKPKALRIVDKQLDNFWFVGMVAAMFPKARIIHCRRDAVETCWSIYKSRFQEPRPYAYDLTSLGEQYGIYEAMMAFWKQWCPQRLYELNYETLVQNTEAEVNRLLEYCGLEPHPDCLRFHETKRSVNTASNVQVRSPLYQSALKASAAYDAFLQPLKESLKRFSPTNAA